MKNNYVKYKKYVSIWSLLSFLVLALSGIALYIAPSCRTAEKIGWCFLFTGKESWEAVHIFFAVLFIISMTVHLFLNWDMFKSYFKKKKNNIIDFKAILFCAVIAILLFLISILNLPPVSWLHRTHEIIKYSWGPPCEDDRPANKRRFMKRHY